MPSIKLITPSLSVECGNPNILDRFLYFSPMPVFDFLSNSESNSITYGSNYTINPSMGNVKPCSTYYMSHTMVNT